MTATKSTYVADVDDFAALATSSSVVRKRIRRSSRGTSSTTSIAEAATTATAGRIAVAATTESTSAAKPTAGSAEAAATATKSTSHTESATASSKATTESATHATSSGTGETVLANFELASIPVVAVEVVDGVTCIVRAFEGNNSGALGAAVGALVYISTDDRT